MKNNICFNNASSNNIIIWLISHIAFPFSKIFFFFKVGANILTLFSIIFTIFAFYFLVKGNYLFFLYFWLFNILLYFCDGQVARLSKNVNKSNFRYDHFSDIFKLSLIFLGNAIYFNLENIWIYIFITNFLYLFYLILQKYQNNKLKKIVKNKKHHFLDYFKIYNFFIALYKVIVPIILQFNGHSLLLILFLPMSENICISILLYFNLLFVYRIVKTAKFLMYSKAK